jgi:hypothetical protein
MVLRCVRSEREKEELVSHKGISQCPFHALFSWMQVFGSQAVFVPSL